MARKANIALILIMLSIIVFQHCYYDEMKENVKVVTETKTDTTYKTCIVTIRGTMYKVLKDSIIDTVYIESDNGCGISVPISQKHYKSESYDAWVSGYRPNLDSINVYQKNNYITIEKKVREVVYGSKTDFYIKGGATMVGREIMPNIGFIMTTPKRMMFGLDLGTFNNKITYSLNIGYKL